ncbi:MAG TPA: hypothetical protein VJP78_01555 [Thermoleophilia bacterium]|nr:hypothetical protein [Thermoleophilia bacterium]
MPRCVIIEKRNDDLQLVRHRTRCPREGKHFCRGCDGLICDVHWFPHHPPNIKLVPELASEPDDEPD